MTSKSSDKAEKISIPTVLPDISRSRGISMYELPDALLPSKLLKTSLSSINILAVPLYDRTKSLLFSISGRTASIYRYLSVLSFLISSMLTAVFQSVIASVFISREALQYLISCRYASPLSKLNEYVHI